MDTKVYREHISYAKTPEQRDKMHDGLRHAQSYRGGSRSVLENLDLPECSLTLFAHECCETLCFQEEEAGRPLPKRLWEPILWRSKETEPSLFFAQKDGESEKKTKGSVSVCAAVGMATLSQGLDVYEKAQVSSSECERYKGSHYYAIQAHLCVVRALRCLLTEDVYSMAWAISLLAQDYAEAVVHNLSADLLHEGKKRALQTLLHAVRRTRHTGSSDLKEKWTQAWSVSSLVKAARYEERCWQARLLAGSLRREIEESDAYRLVLTAFQQTSEDALFSSVW